MRWISTIASEDNKSFDEVGTMRRSIFEGSMATAINYAADAARNTGRRVRMQGWREENFYRKPEPEWEFFTIPDCLVPMQASPREYNAYWRSGLPFTVTVNAIAELAKLDPAAPNWLRE